MIRLRTACLLACTCLGTGWSVATAAADGETTIANPLTPGYPTPGESTPGDSSPGVSPPPVSATEEEMAPLPAEAPDAATEEKMKLAAERMIQQITEGRIAVQAKDTTSLSEHLAKAESEVELLVTADAALRLKQHIPTVRYHIGDADDYYFPIGPSFIAYNELGTAADWPGLKTPKPKDIDLVSTSLSVESDRTLSRIRESNAKLAEGDVAAAGQELDAILKETVKLEEAPFAPINKTVSYFALTQYFLSAENFDNAGFALHHARESLGDLQADKAGSAHKTDIDHLLERTGTLQTTLLKKDLQFLETAKQHVEEWCHQVESWDTPTK